MSSAWVFTTASSSDREDSRKTGNTISRRSRVSRSGRQAVPPISRHALSCVSLRSQECPNRPINFINRDIQKTGKGLIIRLGKDAFPQAAQAIFSGIKRMIQQVVRIRQKATEFSTEYHRKRGYLKRRGSMNPAGIVADHKSRSADPGEKIFQRSFSANRMYL